MTIKFIARAGWLAIVCAMIAVGLAWLSTAEAQAPAPSLTFTKEADPAVVDLGDEVTFTLTVTNVGGAPSTSQTIQDSLPAEFEWVLGDNNLDCSIDDFQVLTCSEFVVPAAFFDGITPVAGVRFVTVHSVAHECGSFPNDAWLTDEDTDEVTVASAFLNVRCPATPTPIATAPPATATPVPATPVPPTPIIIILTPTPQPTVAGQPTATPTQRFVPLPPNTGTGPTDTRREADNLTGFAYALIALAVGSALFLVPLTYTRARRR